MGLRGHALWHWLARSQYNGQEYGGEVGEKKKQNGYRAVVRGSSEEARAVRNGLMLAACLSPETRVTWGPGMLPTAFQDGHDPCFHQGRGDAQGVGRHLKPFWCLRAVPPLGPF